MITSIVINNVCSVKVVSRIASEIALSFQNLKSNLKVKTLLSSSQSVWIH